jgi:hypothetical protein
VTTVGVLFLNDFEVVVTPLRFRNLGLAVSACWIRLRPPKSSTCGVWYGSEARE